MSSAIFRAGGSVSHSGMWNGRPSGKSPRVHERQSPIAQRLSIQRPTAESVWREPQRRGGETNTVFEIAVLRLKMVRSEVHTL
jgi:hypothetical protein